jgi:hypothetical protein
MLRTIHALALSTLVAALLGTSPPVGAQSCTYAAVRKIVDDTGRVLRNIHQESQSRLDAGFRKLRQQRGWSEQDYLEKANQALADERSEAFDAKAGELLTRLDQLAEAAEASTDCAKNAQIEAMALELQATVREKTRYMLVRLDAATREGDADAKATVATPAVPDPAPTAGPGKQTTAQPPAPAPPAAAPTAPTAKSRQPERPQANVSPPASDVAPPATRPAPGASWSTSTSETRSGPPAPPPAPVSPPVAAMPPGGPSTDGYSIDEIQDASRGFFGTLSSELGGVIEYAFSLSGRPTAYVLGTEGGGAFIAGVRYGKGTLYTRSGTTREVYWHGPSIGYDFGASGSKTIFLVYRMNDPLELYTGFSGVDGSAYLVGGVGMTLLTDGRLVLAPIRTGLGLRLGASIGYVRFTSRPTWNPF